MQVRSLRGALLTAGALALAALVSGCEAECEANRCTPPGDAGTPDAGTSWAVYGLKDGRYVHSLGTWPALALAETALADTVAPEHRSETVFSGGYLANNGTHLLTGYSLMDWTGHVAVVALGGSEAPGYLQANGNFTAAALDGVFLLNGQSLGSKDVGQAIYGLGTGTSPFTQSVVAVPGADAGTAFSGYTAVTTDGVAVLGYNAGGNVLRAATRAQVVAALELGTPVDLSSAPVVYAAADLQRAEAFGAGVALVRGSYQSDWTVDFQDVARVALAPPAAAGGAVTVGSPVTALRFEDACTRILFLAPMGEDVLLGLEDKNGRRVVRLHADGSGSGEDRGSSKTAVDCATRAHDAALGTLKLASGFSVVETAALPAGVDPITLVPAK